MLYIYSVPAVNILAILLVTSYQSAGNISSNIKTKYRQHAGNMLVTCWQHAGNIDSNMLVTFLAT